MGAGPLERDEAKLRKDLAVWYTPIEVVKYMVARVDAELRNRRGVEYGLSDQLCISWSHTCGTGAYLVPVPRQVAAALAKKGTDDLASQDLKKVG